MIANFSELCKGVWKNIYKKNSGVILLRKLVLGAGLEPREAFGM